MFISTIDAVGRARRKIIAHKPRPLPSAPRQFDPVAHARQSWRFYIDGARAGMRSDNPARTARCLEAAATWRAILAGHLAGAKQ